MGKKYVLILAPLCNQVTAILINKKGAVEAQGQQTVAYLQNYSGSQAVDPLELLYATRSAIIAACQQRQISTAEIEAIGILDHTCSALIWDKNSGTPLYPAIVGHFQKTMPQYFELKRTGQLDRVKQITGFCPKPNTVAMKLGWIYKQLSASPAAHKKHWLAGTAANWLLFNLTGKHGHASDFTAASRWGLLDIRTAKWSAELIQEWPLSAGLLPGIKSSIHEYGKTQHFVSLPDGISVMAVMASDVACMTGLNCQQRGFGAMHLDEAGVLAVNLGKISLRETPTVFDMGLSQGGDDLRYYAYQDVVLPAIQPQWMASVNGTSEATPMTGTIAIVPEKNSNNLFQPSTHRWVIKGVSNNTSPVVMRQAAFDAACFLLKEQLDLFESDMAVKELMVYGDYTQHDSLLQRLADTLQLPVLQLTHPAPQALGCVWMMHQHTPFFKEGQLLTKLNRIEKRYLPSLDPISSLAHYNQWNVQR